MNRPLLNEVQRRFFGALQMPLRGTSRRSTDLPASDEPHSAGFLDVAERLIRHSPTLLPAECLELYHRQYWFRLLDSVAEDFPGLKRFLGADEFWALIEGYLLRHGSTRFSLRYLGRELAGFVGRSFADEPRRRRARAIARVEWALVEVFEAADAGAATAQQIADSEFTLAPHVRLLELEANASDWLSGDEAAWRHESGTFPAAVWRTADGAVVHRSLEAGEFALLERLRGKPMRMDDWLEAGAEDIPDPETLTRWIACWHVAGWFANPNPNTRS